MASALLLASSGTAQGQVTSRDLILFPDQELAEVTDYYLPIQRTFTDRNVYTIDLRIGSAPTQPVKLVLATNTEWTMVTSVNCTDEFGCKNGIYDARKSSTETIDFTPLLKSVNLGIEFSMTGFNATDAFYFKNGIDMIDRDFPFYIIESVNVSSGILFPYDGVFGLSPDVNGDDYLTLGVPIPLYLKKKDKIKKAIVAIDMHRDSSVESSLAIGKYDTAKFRNKTEKETDLVWFKVDPTSNRFAWRREVKNILYNEKSFDDGMKNEGVFDSFFGGIHLPQVEWKSTFTEIVKNLTAAGKTYLNCNMVNMTCQFAGECQFNKADFKDFDFNFYETRAYSVSPDNYLLDTKDKEGRNMCLVAIYGNRIDPLEYILGDVFMQSMYVILDYENSQFAVNGNYRTVEALGDKPDHTTGSNKVWMIIGIVIGVLALLAIIGGCIVRQKNNRLQENLSKYEQL